MSPESNSSGNTKLATLIRESQEILSNPGRVYELADKRFSLRCAELTEYFESNTFRLAIVGNPNLGKTTLTYSCYQAFQNHHFPTAYVDLDIYSSSGSAISGQIKWEQRLKRPDISESDVRKSIEDLKAVGPGLIVVDFPGKPNDPYQEDRLKAVDLAVILSTDFSDRKKWMDLIEKSGARMLWLNSQLDRKPKYPHEPTLYALLRKPIPKSLEVLTFLTKILEEVAEIKGITLKDIWKNFSEAERVILEEVLDFYIAAPAS